MGALRAAHYCQRCEGLLLPSQYGGYIHAYDSDDSHTPVVKGGSRASWYRRFAARWDRWVRGPV